MAWRSAVIVNALLQLPHFDTTTTASFVDWSAQTVERRSMHL